MLEKIWKYDKVVKKKLNDVAKGLKTNGKGGLEHSEILLHMLKGLNQTLLKSQKKKTIKKHICAFTSKIDVKMKKSIMLCLQPVKW